MVQGSIDRVKKTCEQRQLQYRYYVPCGVLRNEEPSTHYTCDLRTPRAPPLNVEEDGSKRLRRVQSAQKSNAMPALICLFVSTQWNMMFSCYPTQQKTCWYAVHLADKNNMWTSCLSP